MGHAQPEGHSHHAKDGQGEQPTWRSPGPSLGYGRSVLPSRWSLDSESRGQLPEDFMSDLGRNLELLVACEACWYLRLARANDS